MCDAEYKVSKSQRVAAAILSAAILLVMLFSVWFIAEETHHDCVGENCPVCACIQACAETLHQLSGGVTKPKIPVILSLFTVVSAITIVTNIFSSETLISQKIRQNN